MGRSDFELATQSAPAGSRKRFLVRVCAKTGGNLGEDQNRSSPYFDTIFAKILVGDQTKHKKIDLMPCKIFLLVQFICFIVTSFKW